MKSLSILALLLLCGCYPLMEMAEEDVEVDLKVSHEHPQK
jgi:hypothetical protein